MVSATAFARLVGSASRTVLFTTSAAKFKTSATSTARAASRSVTTKAGQSSQYHQYRNARTYAALGVVSIGAAGATALKEGDKVATDDDHGVDHSGSSAVSRAATSRLIRSFIVWTLLGVPVMVDAAPTLLDSLLHSSIPGVQTITEAFVRSTFFAQFIPGETAEECVPAMVRLRRQNLGHALNYTAEADTEEEEALERIIKLRFKEVETALDVQGEFERKMYDEGWTRGSSAFALKVTCLIDPRILVRATNTLHRLRALEGGSDVPYPGRPMDIDVKVLTPGSSDMGELTKLGTSPGVVAEMGVIETDPGLAPGDLDKLRVLWERLDSLADRARRNGVRLILDGEETYYNPVIDGYVRLLSRKYNRPPSKQDKDSLPWTGPVIYGSYQAYLARQPEYLAAALADASANGYVLGLKLVRGGYIVKERAYWEDRTGPGSVWAEKQLTDDCYNKSIETILSALKDQLDHGGPQKALSVIFGTHNSDSARKIINCLEGEGLATRNASGKLAMKDNAKGKVCIAQLYGMRDDLSDMIRDSFEPSKSPVSVIFVAYGSLRETMPFLSRRAIENKSIMSGDSGAALERRRVAKELRRRLSFGLL